MHYYTTTTITPASSTPVFQDEIINKVCEVLGVEPESLSTGCRKTRIKYSRWFIWKILHDHNYTLERLGALFDMDHTSVMNALSKIDADIKKTKWLKEDWSRIKKLIAE